MYLSWLQDFISYLGMEFYHTLDEIRSGVGLKALKRHWNLQNLPKPINYPARKQCTKNAYSFITITAKMSISLYSETNFSTSETFSIKLELRENLGKNGNIHTQSPFNKQTHLRRLIGPASPHHEIQLDFVSQENIFCHFYLIKLCGAKQI